MIMRTFHAMITSSKEKTLLDSFDTTEIVYARLGGLAPYPVRTSADTSVYVPIRLPVEYGVCNTARLEIIALCERIIK
jgi:hypothetical protein